MTRLHTLTPDQLAPLRPFCTTPYLARMLDSVMAGNSPARVWVDDPAQPNTALLWDKAHCLYWLTAAATDSTFATFHNLFTQTILPEAIRREIDVFKVYDNGLIAAAAIPTLFSSLTLQPRMRTFYTFTQPERLTLQPPPTGFHLRQIDRSVLEDSSLQHDAAVRDEVGICWTSLDAFYRHGFGFCMMHEQTIVCWCTAEFVSAGQCGIGIETLEAYQGQGIATATACAFVAHCLKLGIVPHWDAWKANTPSIRVAEKVGFQHTYDYTSHLGFLP